MAGDNRLVTENFLRLNFSPKSGITPGTNDLLSMDCDQIKSRYIVDVSGVTSSGTRCPSQDQISGLQAPTISASNITSTSVEVSLMWNSIPEFLTATGFVLFRHSNGLITETPDADEIVFMQSLTPNTYMLKSGSYYTPYLLPNTTYYTRAVYQTSTGTYYGPEITFTTLP
jgi:hypothetical protein